MSSETIAFQAEVSKVLDIVIHSLYSHHEIFLRELISNASDACDKLRYALLTHPDLCPNQAFKVTITPNARAKTLTVTDNGIGMNREDLVNHLGTIARSGSAEFMKNLTGDHQKDMALIGQFGVGFYASFMVADRVQVRTRKAGDTTGWLWESTGAGSFTIKEDSDAPQGTAVTLFLKKDMTDYLEPVRIRHLVKQYSDFVSVPIVLIDGKSEETLNEANALWARNKADITEAQYRDFYQSVSHAFDAPWLTLHYRAEGVIDYTALLFIPTKPPFNLFQPDRKSGIQLYTNKVFITDDLKDLMPYCLRFVTGVIDTNDLPLNVSREMLQNTPEKKKKKKGIVHKILGELKTRAKNPEDYNKFWESFGIVLKEGLYEPLDERQAIAELCRFRTTADKGWTDLATYIGRMKKGQEAIYYLTGPDAETLKVNPQLEGFTARGVEVLLLSDPIDEFWVQTFSEYQGHKIVSVMHPGSDLAKIKADSPDTPALDQKTGEALAQKVKEILGDAVGTVQMTDRLTKSPMALITPEGQMSLNLERLMKAHGQTVAFSSQRILELNTHHPIIQKMAELSGKAKSSEVLTDGVWVLFNQALIAEGEPVQNPADFAARLERFVMNGLK